MRVRIKKLELLLGKRDDTLLKADTTHLKDLYQISDEEIEKFWGHCPHDDREGPRLLILEA
jgi:hypothetical protein